MAKLRQSKQRDAIYANLSSRYDHPTAEELYSSVKESIPNISLATVYRNLKQLAEIGQIRILHSETADHFDADISTHYHLYCTSCQRIYDYPVSEIPEIAKIMAQDSNLVSYDLVFTGVCTQCGNGKARLENH
ncbi:MAG TPA: transcriptional repressor [Clostridiales bacterium]|nr:transcriptional repressor [Clostridiales bacterium]